MRIQRDNLTSWTLDGACVLFLACVGAVHYWVPVLQGSFGQDSFNLTCLMDEGKLPWFTLKDPKEPGRPFVALPWWLARMLLGGSVAGYNQFVAACLCLTPVVIYVTLRVALPDNPHWAFLAASLKAAWAGDLMVWTNSQLHIHFAELLYCAATLVLVTLHQGSPGPPRSVRITLLASLFALVSVVAGSHQGAWPLILLTPLALLWLPRRANPGATPGLACWYLAAAVWMGFSIVQAWGYLGRRSPPVASLVSNVRVGVKALFWDANVSPLDHALRGLASVDWRAVGLAAAFGFLALWTLRGLPHRRSAGDRARLLPLAALGGVAAAAALFPPSFLYVPVYGSRFLRWASYGSILSMVALYAALPTRRWRGAACVAATVMVGAWSNEVVRAGSHFASQGRVTNSFWEEVVRLTPQVEEGMIVVVDGKPAVFELSDETGTWVLRQFTNTWRTFLLTEGVPNRVDDALLTTTSLDFEDTGPGWSRWLQDLEWRSGRPKVRLPRTLGKARPIRLPLDRAVLLRWRGSDETLEWVAGRPLRSGTAKPTGLGAELFPEALDR